MVLLRQRKPSLLVEVAVVEESATPVTTMFGESYLNLLFYYDMPGRYQDNAFILHGYHPVTKSTRASFAVGYIYIINLPIFIRVYYLKFSLGWPEV